MSISASQVKELRELTGAGMMDCKAALLEVGGDMEAAVDWLRKKGIAKADKKAGRTAAEGLVGVANSGSKAVVVELNSETDFVARNEEFQNLVSGVAEVALTTDGSVESISAATYASSGKSVADTIKDAVATIGENLILRRAASLEVQNGVVASYIHNVVTGQLGKMAVLVAIETDGDKAAAAAFGRQVAMHIAAINPLAITDADVDPAAVAKEKEIFSDQARQSGKPENIIEKMVEGRLKKFFAEVVLLSQPFVVNPDVTVGQALAEAEKQIGASAKIVAFKRIVVGEGVEKEATDFAAEVAAVIKS